MKVYRGFNNDYKNWGCPGCWIWVSESMFYSDRFTGYNNPRMVQFDLDVSRLRIAPYEVPQSEEGKKKLLDAGYNAFSRHFGYDIMGNEIVVYCLFDKSLLSNPEEIHY